MTIGHPLRLRGRPRASCGALTAIMTGVVLRHLGRDGGRARPLPRLQEEPRAHAARDPQPSPRRLRRKHAATRSVATAAGAARPRRLPADRRSSTHAKAAWDKALALGEKHGYRNAQATVIAPTGTIGLVMDCDTTGIEPDFALVKFKKLAGGGYFKIINRAVPEALRTLGYQRGRDRRDRGLCGRPRHARPRRPAINHTTLKAKGFTDEAHRQGREGAADRLRHQVRLQQVDARRGLLPRRARHRAERPRRARLRPARRARLHQARDRGRQHPRLRRDDGGRRAAPEGRALSGVRLRQSVRHASASAISRSKATSA